MATTGVLSTPYIQSVQTLTVGSSTPSINILGSNQQRRFRLVWSANRVDVSNSFSFDYEIVADSPGTSETISTNCYEVTLVVDGVELYNSDTYNGNDGAAVSVKKGDTLVKGSKIFDYNSNGTKTLSVSLSGYVFADKNDAVNGTSLASASASYTLDPIPVYTLTINEGENSHITVNRTSCNVYMKIGELEDGAGLYFGDVLKISFYTDENHTLTEHTLNGNTFSSGGTYYGVYSDISVASVAVPKPSLISATDAEFFNNNGVIGALTNIKITSFNEDCIHDIYYSFEGKTGTVGLNTSKLESSWLVPIGLLDLIPDKCSGVCTLTCRTFKGTDLVGETSCDIKVSARTEILAPKVSGTIVDINEDTKFLTGNSEVLIRYKSTAQCSVEATTQYSATLVKKTVNGIDVTNEPLIVQQVEEASFNLGAYDSRGIWTFTSKKPTTIKYIPLTCNPSLRRLPLSGNTIAMTLTGNMFIGSFGAYSNTLTLQYRYCGTDGIWSKWATISSDLISMSGASYQSTNDIILGEDFTYDRYTFEICAYDGAEDIQLTKITKTVPLARFLPVFDWGENDFNFNVPVRITGEYDSPISINGVGMDYIVEQGVSGIWTYRKWSSGIAECWASYLAEGINIDVSKNGFYASNTVIVPYPPEISFKQLDYYNVSGGSNTHINFVRPFASNEWTYLDEIKWVAVGMSPATSVDVHVHLEAKGRWSSISKPDSDPDDSSNDREEDGFEVVLF